jgi:hypothetical protein
MKLGGVVLSGGIEELFCQFSSPPFSPPKQTPHLTTPVGHNDFSIRPEGEQRRFNPELEVSRVSPSLLRTQASDCPRKTHHTVPGEAGLPHHLPPD